MYYYIIIIVALIVLYMVFVVPKMMKNAKKFYEEIKTQYTGKEEILRKEVLDQTFPLQREAVNGVLTSMAECENHRTVLESASEFASRGAQTLAKRALSGHGGQNTRKKQYHSFMAFDDKRLYYIENELGEDEISKKLVFELDQINGVSLDFNKIKYTHKLKFSYEDKNYTFSIYDGIFPCLTGVFGKAAQMEAAKARVALGDPFIARLKKWN